MLLLLVEPDRQQGRKVAVLHQIAQQPLGSRQRCPLRDGVHLDGQCLLGGELAGVELATRNVSFRVPAGAFQRFEKVDAKRVGQRRGAIQTRARVRMFCGWTALSSQTLFLPPFPACHLAMQSYKSWNSGTRDTPSIGLRIGLTP